MNSVLAAIQDEICKYAEAIAGVTGTDVEIVDEFLIRVGGSGVYRHMLNEDTSHNGGYINRHTMRENRTILVENPGENEICGGCDKRASCREMLDLSTPIVLDQHVIGVIDIICSTPEQRDGLLRQIDKFIPFIEQIADLIAGKAFFHLERQRELELVASLNKLIDVMDRGVIAVDRGGVIQHANLSATRMFGCDTDITGRRIAIEPTGDIVYDSEEAHLRLAEGPSLHALCKRITLSRHGGGDFMLIAFQDARDFLPQSGPAASDVRDAVKLIGRSARMRALRCMVDRIAASDASVLITGESGSGKEVVAFAIHYGSPRRDAPFVTINCAAIPEQLLESELFGYVKGAFSGADPKGRIGKFELAHGGSIFLDEIGDMPMHLQAKLLRVLQERTITRIGSNQVIEIDVRVIAATNKNIEEFVRRAQFREDLYYRLNVVPLELPPLRERREDISELAQHFADEIAARMGRPQQKLPEALTNALYFHDWPGNVRELRNAVEYMLVMQGEAQTLNASHLPRALRRAEEPAAKPADSGSRDEVQAIRDALSRHGWTLAGKQRAAEELGIGIATLYRRIKRYRLQP